MEDSRPIRSGFRHYRRTKPKQSQSSQSQPNGSESDASADSNSVSGDSQNGGRQNNDRHKSVTKKGDWEILSGLKQGQRFEFTPSKFEGYLLKRRKWPLKGWHKRYFVVDASILTYAKNATELSRGKKHGSIDIGMSVISTKASRRRIDIDADTSIIHLKCRSREDYLQWVEQLKQHRLRKQHQLLYSTQATLPGLLSPLSPSDESPTDPVSAGGSRTGTLAASLPGSLPGTLGRDTFPPGNTGSGTLRARVFDPSVLEGLTGDFAAASQTLHQLNKLHQSLVEHTDSLTITESQQGDPTTPISTKTRRKFRLRKHKNSKSSTSNASQDTISASPLKPSTPSLVHQSSLVTAGDRTSTQSEDISQHLSATTPNAGGNLSELKKLSSSNPSLSLNSNQLPPQPSNQHFFPPNIQQSNSSSPLHTANADNLSTTSVSSTTLSAPPPSLTAPPPSISVDSRYSSGTPPHTSILPSNSVGNFNASLAQDFNVLAKDLLSQVSSLYRTIVTEKDLLQQSVSNEGAGGLYPDSANSTPMMATLKMHLNTALQQNAELRNRLSRIHCESDISNLPSLHGAMSFNAENVHKTLVPSMSYESSSCFSNSEYFDAEGGSKHPHSDEDDANDSSSDDRSTPASETTSDASDACTDAMTSATDLDEDLTSKCITGRRTTLPAPHNAKEDFSLLNFLYKNIGKDLSKVSMPITINEPLNMLQRMCEELEYSELLDKAASLRDPSERMVQVAAFAVSAYASSIHRAAHKPFNPLLGETYECVREDKGFRYVAEQVSHHPPISASHTHGSSFTMWQDIRIKTKFWGKSLEFQPSGTVRLKLNQHNDEYEWNKVTSCVHNLFGGGTRWVDQYGEAVITNSTYGITCKLTFVKASSWSSKKHEVYGTITDSDGAVLHNLFGRWTEALYCGHAPSARVVWRPGSMPENSHLYYGFTTFAIELNELCPDIEKVLPPTDTRFRPDQRLIEEGRTGDAEEVKKRLESEQRERRKEREREGTSHVPMWFRHQDASEGSTSTEEDAWVFNGEYWNKRRDPGFESMSFEHIW